MVTVESSARAGVAIKAAHIANLAAHLVGFIEISSRAVRAEPAVPPLLTSEPMIPKTEASLFRHARPRASMADGFLRHRERSELHQMFRRRSLKPGRVPTVSRTCGVSGRDAVKSASVRRRNRGLLRYANKKQTVIPLIFLYKLGAGKEKL